MGKRLSPLTEVGAEATPRLDRTTTVWLEFKQDGVSLSDGHTPERGCEICVGGLRSIASGWRARGWWDQSTGDQGLQGRGQEDWQ